MLVTIILWSTLIESDEAEVVLEEESSETEGTSDIEE